MNVKTARQHIEQINNICETINQFDEKHQELHEETGFLCDAVAFLCDYRNVLEKAIENAEVKL